MLDDRPYMRTPYRPGWSMTTILIVTLVACFLGQMILGALRPELLGYLALSREGLEHWRVYELITFQFMHDGLWHLLGNLITLYFFGRPVESLIGKKGMLQLYLAGGTVGGLLQVGLDFVFPVRFAGAVVGASAGIFGLVAAFVVNAPDDPITMLVFFFLPITFPAKVLLIIEAVISSVGILAPLIGFSFMPGIAHGSHLGGMLTGILWVRWGMRDHNFNFWPRRSAPRRESVEPPKNPWKTPRKRAEELPPAEFISREVDPILEKISAQGIHSLTDRERQILEAARNRMAKR